MMIHYQPHWRVFKNKNTFVESDNKRTEEQTNKEDASEKQDVYSILSNEKKHIKE